MVHRQQHVIERCGGRQQLNALHAKLIRSVDKAWCAAEVLNQDVDRKIRRDRADIDLKERVRIIGNHNTIFGISQDWTWTDGICRAFSGRCALIVEGRCNWEWKLLEVVGVIVALASIL